MRRAQPLSGLIGALAMLVCVHDAHSAQISDYPNHPIRFIVPYAPGGALDASLRLVGEGKWTPRDMKRALEAAKTPVPAKKGQSKSQTGKIAVASESAASGKSKAPAIIGAVVAVVLCGSVIWTQLNWPDLSSETNAAYRPVVALSLWLLGALGFLPFWKQSRAAPGLFVLVVMVWLVGVILMAQKVSSGE